MKRSPFYAFERVYPSGHRLFVMADTGAVGLECPDGYTWMLMPHDIAQRLEQHAATFYAPRQAPRWRRALHRLVRNLRDRTAA